MNLASLLALFRPCPPTRNVPRKRRTRPRRGFAPVPPTKRPRLASSKPANAPRVTAYHGTTNPSAAASILRHGFLVGSGNLYGDGIYLSTSLSEAKGYASKSGVYLRCSIDPGRCATWNADMERQYRSWCRERRVPPDNSAKTAFLIQRGYHSLRAGTVFVVLAPQYANQAAWKRKNRRIRILSVHRAKDDKRIRL